MVLCEGLLVTRGVGLVLGVLRGSRRPAPPRARRGCAGRLACPVWTLPGALPGSVRTVGVCLARGSAVGRSLPAARAQERFDGTENTTATRKQVEPLQARASVGICVPKCTGGTPRAQETALDSR